MNKADVLQTTVTFMLADQEYLTAIRHALIYQGRMRSNLKAGELEKIKLAKQKREDTEAAMYSSWTANGMR